MARPGATVLVGLAVLVAGCLRPVSDVKVADIDVAHDTAPRFQPPAPDISPVDGFQVTPADADTAEPTNDVASGDGLADGLAEDATATVPADATEATDDVADGSGLANDATAASPVCGDGTCDTTETCKTCPEDCAVCPPPVCDPIGSSGCKDGLQCYPDPKENLCGKPGTKAHGAPCKGWNECEWATLCVGGQCRSICDVTGKKAAWVCEPGVPCEKLQFEGGGDAGKNLGACKP